MTTTHAVGHTPGPWQVHQPDTQTLAVHTRAGSIAEWPTNYDPRDVADARLIAAAPELLEVLRDMLAAQVCGDNCAQCSAARAAIAKAEGRT
jgi:hypothetical protein